MEVPSYPWSDLRTPSVGRGKSGLGAFEWRKSCLVTITNDAMILEPVMTGTVIGSLPGLPGNGRRISFRIVHVFELRNGLISDENVWLDSPAIVDQLSRR